jgi:hypothetical protein
MVVGGFDGSTSSDDRRLSFYFGVSGKEGNGPLLTSWPL